MIKEVMTGAYVRNGETFEFKFFNNLSTKEKMTFVKTVTNTIIGEDYDFILKDLIFDFHLISVMTDVDLSEMKDTKDSIGFMEEFLEETNIVDILKANVVDGLIEELTKALNVNLEYKTGVKINSLSDALTSLLSTIEKKIGSVDTEEMMETAMNLTSLIGQISPNQVVESYIGQTLNDK